MLYIPTPWKRCTECGKELPPTIEFFYKSRESRDSLRPACKECINSKNRQWAAEHPQDRRAARRRWRLKHGEKVREIQQRYEAKNGEQIRARRRERYSANEARREIEREKSRKRAANGDQEQRRAKHEEWKRANPDKVATHRHRRRARELALPVTFTATDWRRALDYFGCCCAVCGRPPSLWRKLVQDHWIPVNKGGGYTPDNIIPLCHGRDGCNNSKHNRDAEEWLTWKFGKRKASEILQRIAAYFDWIKQNQAEHEP